MPRLRPRMARPVTLVDTPTAALALGVTEATIRSWVHRGKLQPTDTNPIRFRTADLLAVKDKRRVDFAA